MSAVIIQFEPYLIAKAVMTDSDLSEGYWKRVDAEIAADPTYWNWVRECRIYRKLERARKRK